MTNKNGRFGEFGGQYVPETLMNELINLEKAYEHYKNDEEFNKELDYLMKNYAGRPSLLYYAEKMTKDLGGAKIYLKREDLNHTGAHKINNCLGQVLLAKKMGKTRVIAETGAGQHGVATATVAALLGMECEIFMGELDCQRQKLNVYRMELLGAKVHHVKSGSMVLKDAVNEALKDDWLEKRGLEIISIACERHTDIVSTFVASAYCHCKTRNRYEMFEFHVVFNRVYSSSLSSEILGQIVL